MKPLAMPLLALVAVASLAGCASGPPPVPDRLDARDLALMAQTAQTALETGHVGEGANWVNEATGHRGTVTPIRTIEDAGAPPCRVYQVTATVDGDTALGRDVACRRADGIWVSRNYDGLADVLRYGNPDRWQRDPWRDPYWDDPFCRPYRYGYDPWCRRPRSGVSIGIGGSF